MWSLHDAHLGAFMTLYGKMVSGALPQVKVGSKNLYVIQT
jgi:hypothetical protein